MNKPLLFHRLNPTRFEEFCSQLMGALGYLNVDWRKGTAKKGSPADKGRDIECQQPRTDLDGATHFENWFVDCKHFKKGVPPTELHNLLTWADAKKPDVALIITSGFLSNGAKDYLKEYQENRRPPFRIKVWEAPQLEALTPVELAKKFDLIEEPVRPKSDIRLIQAEKKEIAEQLISAIVHDLNNPLVAISGYVQLMLLDNLKSSTREDLKQVDQNVRRCRKIIDSLLFFSRSKQGGKEDIDLNAAVGSALSLLEFRLAKAGEDIRVKKILASNIPRISGNSDLIVQVLANLIGNACDAMNSPWHDLVGKELTIRTSLVGECARIEIEDNGSGIPAEVRDKIFQPFFTTKEPGKGTGLGLAVSRDIVENLGGNISFSSREGEGSIFCVNLPRIAVGRALQNKPVPYPRIPKKHVLIADDDPNVAELIKRLLIDEGCRAEIAHGGHETLRKIQEKKYDLVISRISMAQAAGAEIFSALARRQNPPCILFITEESLNPRVMEFLSRSNAAHLAMPFDLEDLRQNIRRLLAADS